MALLKVDAFFVNYGNTNNFTECQPKLRDLNYTNVPSTFWLAVAKQWQTFQRQHFHIESTLINILNEPSYHNENIQYGNKTLNINKWRKANILHVKDLFIDQGFITYEQLRKKTGNYATLMFDYNAMRNAIPKKWTEIIINNLPRLQNDPSLRTLSGEETTKCSDFFKQPTQ